LSTPKFGPPPAASARRFASTELRGYPALRAKDETEATLSLAPPETTEKKPKPALSAHT
jgi:hypothetical protein